jgi:hypothetical protein
MFSRRRCFHRISTFPWLALFWLSMIAFYVLFVIGTVQTRGLFDYLGSDYALFRAAADVAWREGPRGLYDLPAQEFVQRGLYEDYATGPMHARYEPAPMVYLPPFAALFLPLVLLPPVPGFIIWTGINLVGLVLYVWRLGRALEVPDWPALLPLVLVSAPAFANWFFGQVGLLLLIGTGEFIIAWRRGHELAAGLWLAGLLLKPQMLVLILPALLLRGRFRILAGFAMASMVLLLLSVLVVGPAGMVDLGQLLLGLAGSMPATKAFVMTNWRAVGVHLQELLPTAWAWGIAWGGTALTALVTLLLWLRAGKGRRSQETGASGFPGAWLMRSEPWTEVLALLVLGTWAATGAATWHAHVNQALPLLAPLMLLRRRLPAPLWNAWFIVPTLILPVAFLTIPQLAHNLIGLSLFLLNLILLGWVVHSLWRAQPCQTVRERADG